MHRKSSERAVRLFAVVLAVVVVGWSTLGAGVASGQGAESYAVRQGDRCVDVTPLSGNESVLEFYGYQSTIEDNPYTTEVGPGFSSNGTIDLQAAETSLLFLYADPGGNLSLVMVHGAREEGVDGGSASFDLSGLPADGRWAVKDDEYDSPENYDNWTHGETTATVDWTWSRSATDGGAYAGLGEEFNVTVEPAFNGDAELFGQANFGVVENWTLLSGNRANPNRTPLDRSEAVTVSTVPCDDADEGGERDAGRGEDGLDRDAGNPDGGADDAAEDDDEDGDGDGDEDAEDAEEDEEEGDAEDEDGDDDGDEDAKDDDGDDEDEGEEDKEDEDAEDEDDERGEDDDGRYDDEGDRDREDERRGGAFEFGDDGFEFPDHDDDGLPWFDDDDDDDADGDGDDDRGDEGDDD